MSPVRNKDNACKKEISNGVRVLAVTGSSGGHIFPALSFLDAVKEKYGAETLFVLPQKNIISQQGDLSQNHKTATIAVYPLSLKFNLNNLCAAVKFFRGSLESLFILARFQPDVVVGFGSLVSVPAVIFAWLLRIPTLIHEQNVIPGQANRFLSWFAQAIAVSFSETKGYFRHAIEKKINLTGNPLRRGLLKIEKQEALDFFGFSRDKLTFLISGGSAGAHKINLDTLNALSAIKQKDKLQVIHLSGKEDYAFLKESYQKLGISFKLYAFFDKMQYAYAASDLVLSRSGAGTISEIIYFGLAAILVPYPYAHKHQLANAGVLERINSAVIIEDNALSQNKLKELIEDFMDNPHKLSAMRRAYAGITPGDAAAALAATAVSLLE